MTGPARRADFLQTEAFAAIGSAPVIVQMAERMVKFRMQYVLHKEEGGLTYEKINRQETEEAKETLGYFLTQLRLRAEIDPAFDDRLKDFLKQRNQLAHGLHDVPGLAFTKPEELKATTEWARRLSGLALYVRNVFMGLARAWQYEIGMKDNFSHYEFFQEVDVKFRPLANQFFTARNAI